VQLVKGGVVACVSQADYCGVLLSIIVKLGENPEYKTQMINAYADQLMALFLQVRAWG
jgi:hypothetical protein